GNSGSGSYGRLAEFKATVLNDLVASKSIRNVIEFGCGDGAQLGLARYPHYVGVDVSPASVAACAARFAGDASKVFMTLETFRRQRPKAELGLSLDVIYHLVEDEVFDDYMRNLFNAAERLVAIYSSNSTEIGSPAPHVRHRRFTGWIEREAPEWRLVATHKNPYPFKWWDRKNTSFCDLFTFERQQGGTRTD
ncbi:MAG TPA: class I SAM-dependent methyltransferase, partial [Dongiaceae bacterium]|nr:class I SAM-dependent methyltransferase [Dongiaceae bacterium]